MFKTPVIISFFAIIFSAIILMKPTIFGENPGAWLWPVWIIVPPLWFIVEYSAAYHGWFKPRPAEADLEHLRHLQSLFTGLWVAVAAFVYWFTLERH